MRVTVVDSVTGKPLETVSVLVSRHKDVHFTDAKGQTEIDSLKSATYTLVCTYVGYYNSQKRIDISSDKDVLVLLCPESFHLHEVSVTARREKIELATLNKMSLTGTELEKTRGLSLGESLKAITGVNSIQTGPAISKPIIHGLHSNRILILNNGVRQEGQQWGSEHAPEIDQFIAGNLSVIKGAASIRYGADAIGGVVLVEPPPMPTLPGTKGEINLAGMSNGHMGAGSLMLQGAFDKKLEGLSWRLQGSLKRAGNFKTANYYMENTGFDEKDFSATLSYEKTHYGASIFFSEYNNQIGVFTGTSVGNINDMNAAIQRPEPITPSYFSYSIQRPYQLVKHDLLKVSGHVLMNNGSKIEAVFATQRNQRSEYDYVPLSGNLNPELYLDLNTQTADLILEHKPSKAFSGSMGINSIVQGNVREFQFLIPNYKTYGSGVFVIEKWTHGDFLLEGGLRYDYRWMRAYMPDNNTATTITPTYEFNNMTGTVGAHYKLGEHYSVNSNFGTAWRPPNVNELLSNGVHQSAASYEKGNPNLRAEQAYNFNISVHASYTRLNAEVGFYNNTINNYIYAKPDLKIQQTSRGAFPSFSYTAANVVFRGVDLTLDYAVTKSFSVISKTGLIWAYNYTDKDYLMYVPSNRFDNAVKYTLLKTDKHSIRNLYFGLGNLFVTQQSRVPANSDYTSPPAAYMLWSTNIGCLFHLGKQDLTVDLSATNMTNVAYRDYLNRYRYFTDDLGRNITLRVKIPFTILKTN